MTRCFVSGTHAVLVLSGMFREEKLKKMNNPRAGELLDLISCIYVFHDIALASI